MLERPIVVTGGSGFIGSALVRRLVSDGRAVVNVDKLTYASSPESLRSAEDSPLYEFEQLDICDRAAMRSVMERHRPGAVLHLAAETHVDRSIDAPSAFIDTNVVGTYSMLEAAEWYRGSLPPEERAAFRFVHVSTDEVFGSLGEVGVFHANTPYDPRSPYSASKAAADHLARSWHHTFGLPVIVTNTCNNFGPFQFPEKLIPLTVLNALDGKPIRVYGRGLNTREWLFVDDHVEALLRVMEAGEVGSTYLIGSGTEMTNIEVVRHLCAIVDRVVGRSSAAEDLITFVPDRPGHDFRYAIDSSEVRKQLGWTPRRTFLEALEATVEWYASNRDWCARVQGDRYGGERLGLAAGQGAT
jgi:dTDP-glucose 4,6-dehydratase